MKNVIFFLGQCAFLPTYFYTTYKLLRKPLSVKSVCKYMLLAPFVAYIYTIVITSVIIEFIPKEYKSMFAPAMDLVMLFVSIILMIIYGKMIKAKREGSFLYACLYMVSMPFTSTYDSVLTSVLINVLVPVLVNAAYIVFIADPFTKLVKEGGISSNRFFIVLPIVGESMFVLRILSFVFFYNHSEFKQYDSIITIYNWVYAVLVMLFVFIAVRLILNCMKEEVRYKNASERLQKMSIGTATSLVRAIEVRDPYTNGHSERVAKYTQMIATKLGYDKDYIDKSYYIAILHDIGKIGIADGILQKQGPLTDDEYREIQQHTVKGYHILASVEEIANLADGALYHHEKWDGTGYPFGKKGEEIPEIARIISVADAYDAMTSTRPYRAAMTQKQVYEQIKRGIGTQFWPEAAEKMIEIIQEDTEFIYHQ